MTSSPDHLLELFETLVEGEATPERLQASEAALAEDPTGRLLLAARDAWRRPPETAPPADLAAGVMAGLPELPPGGRTALAQLILAAWTDLEVREAVRQDPRAALAARDLVFPAQATVRVVVPAEARLPSADRITLPVPPPGRRPVPAAEALRLLGASAVGWLWGPPWLRAAGERGAERTPRPARRRWWRLAPALAAGAAVLAVAWLVGLNLLGPGDLSGTAGEMPPGAGGRGGIVVAAGDVGPAVALGVGLVVALVVAWLWWRRR